MNESPPGLTSPPPIGQMLVDSAKITEDDLVRALAHKRESGMRLGQVLIELGLVSPEDLSYMLRKQGKVNCIRLRPGIVDRGVACKLGEEYSRQHTAIAINRIAGVTTVAMQDPTDVYTVDELARKLGGKVITAYAETLEIEECLDTIFDGRRAVRDELEEIVDLATDGEVQIDVAAAEQEVIDIAENLEGPVAGIIQAILKEAFEANASDIHLEPRESTFVVRFRVDGSLFERMVMERSWARPCVSRLKVMSNLDIAQRRLPQDGRAQISVSGRRVDLRISTIPAIQGEVAVVRILDGGRQIPDLSSLGLRAEQESRLISTIESADGVVLAVGPTGSGKTTSLYALLNQINRPDRKIITLEDPVENRVDNIAQVNTNDKAGLTFARGLRSILRQDPDVILVGEIRDRETAQIAIQAALTGHMVLSTLHTIGAAETVSRLREMGMEHYLLADTLRGIIAQRLLRKSCVHCKEPITVDARRLKALGLDPGAQFFEGRGCERCANTGYLGRQGIFEIMTMPAPIRDAMRAGAGAGDIRILACQHGMTTLRQEGLALALAGMTTLEEVLATTPQE